MIVTALLGLVMAGMYNMFVHQQKSYSVQDHVSAMQQNARVGLEYMVKDIRMAGYIPEGIPFDADDPPVPAPQKPAPPAPMLRASPSPTVKTKQLKRPLPPASPSWPI